VSKKLRTARTNEELVANSVHVLYAIQMFAGTGRLISAAPRTSDGISEDERVQVLALIESRLTNARALMRFLYPTGGAWATDILAEDYLFGAPPLPAPWDRFDADLSQLDQELAHLTYERSTGVVNWDFGPALTAALLAFVKSVPEDRVLPGFQVEAWKALVNQSSRARLVVGPRTDRTDAGAT
jgi:hypothetical protein